jgi:hypothetical protein
VNGVVFAGFGGHCDLFNYTGWVVGMSTAGKYVTGYVTSGGPGAPPEDGTWNGGGGAAGIWMAGAAIASDNSGRLFVATGNGKGTRVNNQAPASGHVHLDTLSECIVNLAVNPQNGSLTQGDYFEPYGYLAMDAGDRDLGSGGVVLPDPSVFSGGGVSRLAITCGKNAVCYVANADNLGGYKMGPAGGDAIVQTITPPGGGSMFGNPGTYPLEGGYLYISPVGSPTYVYSLGFDTTGRPAFTLVAQTDDSSPGAVSVGPATVTTLNGQPGTGILWIVDTNGVRAYNAVPVNGKMVKINLPAMPGPLKFQRPAFGNGRYYMTAGNGAILGFGAPVALPLNCTSPVDFGSVNIGSTKTVMVNCTANIAIVQIQGLSMGKSIYQAQNSSLPQGSLKAGDSFSIPVTFNLTGFVLTSNSTSAPAVSPGVQTTAMSLYTTNGATGYSTQQGITLTGVSVSASPFVAITPLQVTFPGIVIGSASTAASTGTFIIQNLGSSDMTILGYAYSADSTDPYTNVTTGASPFVLDENGYFTSQDLPSIGTIIPAGKEVTVHANFNTSTVGDYFTLLTVFSNGGSAYIILTGSANTAPVALLESSTAKGWAGIPDCAVPADGCTTQINMGTFTGANTTLKTIRLTNNGGSNLVITKSKPPVGSVLGATSPNTDFSEGLAVAPGGKTTATVYFQPGQPVLNSPPIVYSGAWTLNTNDLTFGVHVLNFTGTLAPPQVGPLLPNGTARFQYLGCFQDTMGARIEPTEVSNVNNTNGLCQQQAFAANLPFAGTEFQTECWTGSTIPAASLKVADSKCTGYTCPGDTSQLCGGPGGFLSLYYDSQKYNPSTGSFIGGYAPPSAPPHVGAYTYAGCFSDNAGARTLNVGSVGVGSTNSLENCAASCKGYLYFGTEFATQCYCGNKLLNNPIQEPDSQCNKVCPGNSSELCGASSRLTLYVLSNSTNTTTTSTTTTSSSSTTSSSTSLTTSYTNTTITTSTTSSSTISSSSSSVSSTSSASPWSYVGCANDTSAHRALNSAFTSSNDSMTVETCQSFCLGKNYPLAGLEFSTQCFCGLSLGSYSTIGYPGCTMACSGSSTETCGGSSRLSVYNYTNYAYPQLVQDVGTYTLFGCFTDTQGARGLSNSTAASSTSMTVESCVSICQQRGYSKAGVEYGSECYCGNTIANTSTQAPISDCMTKFCTGELTEFCGGSKRLLVYSSDP